MIENIYFVGFALGCMIAIALLSQIFTPRKSGFFLGIVVLVLAFELLLSWTSQSGTSAFFNTLPPDILLNYLLIPPSLWIFLQYHTDPGFEVRARHTLLYIPALIEFMLQILSLAKLAHLKGNLLWTGFSEYLPLLWFVYVLIHYWTAYLKKPGNSGIQKKEGLLLNRFKLPALMFSLTLLGIFWITFTLIGWKYYFVIEYLIIFLFFGLAFLNFLEGQSFPRPSGKKNEFSRYNDPESLERIERKMTVEKAFTDPGLTLKEFAGSVQLPERYVSYLINHYRKMSYKEYINQYRIEAFIAKANSGEKETKTILALAMESGFNSKSTFNQVFKNHTGKTPSEFLK
ncbi:helix-turn-helix domain-containing protein [Robertkochia flava]|uniref:helix-turn-helix domain-containing protein n=1 Tax=Robertkochia flava TaxID=3447986 RepID=UPI001CCD6886|nr:helix-turn-helix domain-containing protein [Robertkochia marina]